MTTPPIRFPPSWFLAIIIALLMGACGGGGGHSSANENVVSASLPENAFTATLSGAQAIPPNSSAGLAAGSAIFDPATRTIRTTLTTAAIAGTAVQVQDGSGTAFGSAVLALAEAVPGSGVWSGQAILTDAQINALQAGSYFFNVLTAVHTTGEIRGQILPRLSTPGASEVAGAGTTVAGLGQSTVFKNALTGAQVVPPSSSGATGIVTAAIDDVAKTMSVAVNTVGITGTEAHLHEGAPGINGGVLTPLVQTSSGIWSAKLPLSDSQINSALNGNFYVEVHSLAFPAGELRGQVAVLERVRGISDCRFGGFGVDNCVLDDGGFFFVGFGFGFDEFAGGFIPPDFAPPPFGFDGGIGGGMDGGFGGMDGGFIGGGFGFDTPAPGIFLPLRGKS